MKHRDNQNIKLHHVTFKNNILFLFLLKKVKEVHEYILTITGFQHFPAAPLSSLSPESMYSVDSICDRGGGCIVMLG